MLTTSCFKITKEEILDLRKTNKKMFNLSFLELSMILIILISILVLCFSYVSLSNEIKININFHDYLFSTESDSIKNNNLIVTFFVIIGFAVLSWLIIMLILLFFRHGLKHTFQIYLLIDECNKNIYTLFSLANVFGFFVNFLLYKKSKEIIENLDKIQYKTNKQNWNYVPKITIDKIQKQQITSNELIVLNLKRKLLIFEKLKNLGLFNDKEYYEIKEKIFIDVDYSSK